MNPRVEIIFRHMVALPGLREDLCREAEKLLLKAPQITHCQVTVDAPNFHGCRDHDYHVSLLLRLPDRDLTVNHSPRLCHGLGGDSDADASAGCVPGGHLEPKSPYASAHCTFQSAQRLLDDWLRQEQQKPQTYHQAPDTL